MNPIRFLIAFLLLPTLLFADYTISTEAELKSFQSSVANGTDHSGTTVSLAKNITLTSNWTPIGDKTNPFKGTFDGKGYTISGLSVNVSTPYAGLFGYVDGGQIKNLNVIGSTITTTFSTANQQRYAGGLAAYYVSSYPIENCSVQASIYADGSTLTGGSGSGASYAGGLVGYIQAIYSSATGGAIITNSHASGSVAAFNVRGGTSYAGGLVGFITCSVATNNFSITDSYSTGKVDATGCVVSGGSGYAGGLVGYAGNALTITRGYSSGNVYGSGCDIDGTYRGNGFGGGLVGYASRALIVSNCYSSGNVSAAGAVNHSFYSGGLVGDAENSSSISNCYVSGSISTLDDSYDGIYGYSGGIFGKFSSGGGGTSVYYNSAGASTAAGLGSPSGISSKSAADLKKKSTFSSWDFNNVWDIVDGYSNPFLMGFPYPLVYYPLTDVEAEYIFGQTYTGNDIKPEPRIRLKGTSTMLTKGTHYDLSYQNNRNAGTGTIVITGKGTYSTLHETMTFKIIPKAITFSGATAHNKTYDGTTTATITGTLEGVLAGDNVSFEGKGTFANKDVGTAKAVAANITLTGTNAGNYKITQPTGLTANITKKALTITLDPKTITKKESEAMPNLTDKLVYNGLVSGDAASVITGTTTFNYNPAFTGSPAVGEYSITLSGLRSATNYEVSYDTGLKLVVTAGPVNLSTCTATNISAQTYAGSQLKPAITVTCNTTLTLTTDYTLSYGENKNAGTGTITITGTGAYTGTLSKTFTINKKALSVTGATAQSKTYDGTTAAVITGATLSGGVISGDVVALSNHTTGTFASANAGADIAVSTSISLTGAAAANYSLEQPTGLKANIEHKELEENAIQPIASQTFTGSPITPAVVVMDGSKTLTKDTDYSLTFSSNTNIGTNTAVVRVIGKGNYTGVETANFTISVKQITPSMVSPIPDQIHTGTAIEPTLEIKNNGILLIANTDYTAEYEDNLEIGTALVIVLGKGNYSGKIYPTFEIVAHLPSSSSIAIPSSSSEATLSSSSATTLSSSSTAVTSSSSSATTQSSSSSEAVTPSSSSNTRCKDSQNRELFCNWASGCYAIDPEFAETPGQTCAVLVQECRDYGSLFTGPSVEGAGKRCATPSSSSRNTSSSSATTPSSSSRNSTPVLLPQKVAANAIFAMHNAINLQVQSTAKLNIYNLNGKLQKSLNFTGGVYNIPLGNLPKGMYIASVKFSNPENRGSNKGIQTKVVIK
jgi:hypothetical protein